MSYLSYPAINTAVFPDDYRAARATFLNHISTLPITRCQSYLCPGSTPDGETLHTDAVWLGPEDAANVLVILGGTHGVEGFVGSAVQIDHLQLIDAGALNLPNNTALLVVHALTPWGYAWLRRCDQDGVDLNRNYVDFSQPFPPNAGYQHLRSALFSVDNNHRQTLFAAFEQQHGKVAFEVAVSGGQYGDPSGPFFGGKQVSHGRLVTEDLIKHHALGERKLAVIDLHSGLGSYGYGEIICDHAPRSSGVAVAQGWYGDSVTFPALGTSSSVPKLGLMDYAWHDIMNTQSCHITLEFGSYSTGQLFDVLLRDHQLWAQADNWLARKAHSIKMRQHFCPDDCAWQELVLFRARQVIHQALQGLAGHA